MVIAKIYVDGVSANVTDLQKIPKGIAGAVIEVTYATNWEGLTKTAVFAGAVTRDVLNADGDILVPTETVARSGYRLRVGFYGVDGEKNVIIPTLWADLGTVQDAADPSGDPGTDPELPVWAQLQKEFEELKEAGGLKGDPGFSPIAKVTQTESGAEISITDEDGTTTATVENGKPGAPGNDYVLTPADKTEIAEMAAELVEVPEAPEVSMKPLIFTGAVNATYDGSEEVTVEIPQGGGGEEWEYIGEFNVGEEDVEQWTITEDANGKSIELRKMYIECTLQPATATTANTALLLANPAFSNPFVSNSAIANLGGRIRTSKSSVDGTFYYCANGEGSEVIYCYSPSTYTVTWSRGGNKKPIKKCIGGIAMKTGDASTGLIGAGSTIKIWGVRV